MHPNRLRARLIRGEVAVRILDRQVPGVKRFCALLDQNHLGPRTVGVLQAVAGAKVACVDLRDGVIDFDAKAPMVGPRASQGGCA